MLSVEVAVFDSVPIPEIVIPRLKYPAARCLGVTVIVLYEGVLRVWALALRKWQVSHVVVLLNVLPVSFITLQ